MDVTVSLRIAKTPNNEALDGNSRSGSGNVIFVMNILDVDVIDWKRLLNAHRRRNGQ
jgi:hypothetical protein